MTLFFNRRYKLLQFFCSKATLQVSLVSVCMCFQLDQPETKMEKTMAAKLMHIPNGDTQNFDFFISLGRVVVSSPKINKNLPRTYKNLPC